MGRRILDDSKYEPSDDRNVWEIVGVVLLIAFLLLVAFVVIRLNSGMIGGVCCSSPEAALGQPNPVNETVWEIEVIGVSENKNLENWNATLVGNGALVEVLDPLSGSAENLAFTDIGGEEELSVGDYFELSCSPATKYELRLVWKDMDELVASVEWETEGYVPPPEEVPEKPITEQPWFWLTVVLVAIFMAAALNLEREDKRREQ